MGMYSGRMVSFMIGDMEQTGLITNWELQEIWGDLVSLSKKHDCTFVMPCKLKRPAALDPEVVKMLKAQPTRPIKSTEPWRQSFKRQSRQIRKAK